jgi:photosystem II stability/assembly factor-like uncharacterized protein
MEKDTMHPILRALAFTSILGTLAHAAPLQAATWQPRGPDGGTVADVAADPFHSGTVLAGTADSGLFRSGDGGTAWAAVAGVPAGPAGPVAFDPRHAGTAYAGALDPASRRTHVFKTTDGGVTWTAADAGLPVTASRGLAALAVDARRPGTVYASFAVSVGLYRSVDGGTSWAFSGLAGIPVLSLAVDPASPAVYAGTGDGVYRSLDGGTTWTRRGLNGTVVSLLALSHGSLYAGGDGLFRSTDGGAHWRTVRRGLPGSQIAALAVHPLSSAILYVSLPGIPLGSTAQKGGLFRSTDGGAHWTALTRGLPAPADVIALAVDPRAPSRVLAGLAAEGVFRSTDGGSHWVAARRGLHALPVPHIAGSGLRGEILAAGPTERGLFLWAGTEWLAVNDRMRSLRDGGLSLDPGSAGIYAGIPGRLERSDDAGEHWRRIDAGLAAAGPTGPIAVDPRHRETVYAGTLSGVSKSTDRGAHWQAPAGSPPCTTPERLLVSPADSSILFLEGDRTDAGCREGGGAFRSTDGGGHWQTIGAARPTPDPADAAIVYGLGAEGVLRSTDGGATFAPAGAPGSSPPGVSALAVDLVSPATTLYAGTLDGGVFVSTDAGATWAPLGDGLSGAVLDLAVDAIFPQALYAGTTRGVFMTALEIQAP